MTKFMDNRDQYSSVTHSFSCSRLHPPFLVRFAKVSDRPFAQGFDRPSPISVLVAEQLFFR